MTPGVVILGPDGMHVSLAVTMARCGLQPTLVIADPYDQHRLRQALRSSGVQITGDCPAGDVLIFAAQYTPADLRRWPLALCSSGAAPGVENCAALCFLGRQVIELGKAGAGPSAVKMATALAGQMGRYPIWTRGDIASRLLDRAARRAEQLMLSGATPWDLDAALEAAGFAMGLCAAQDIEGLDVARQRRKGRIALISDRMMQEGRLGRQAGVGWYRYPGGGGAVIDPLIEDLIREEAHFAAITRQALSGDAIASRIIEVLQGCGRAALRVGAIAPDDYERLTRDLFGTALG